MEDEDLLGQRDVSRAGHWHDRDFRPADPPPLTEVGHNYRFVAVREAILRAAPGRQPLGIKLLQLSRRQGDGRFVIIDARHINILSLRKVQSSRFKVQS
jgi:hypothetical protein